VIDIWVSSDQEESMLRVAYITAIALTAVASAAHAQQSVERAPPIVVPKVDPAEIAKTLTLTDPYPKPNLPNRASFAAAKTDRGKTIPIPESTIIQLCSGMDGCSVRLGMYNWDDTGRVASREFLFFYNAQTKVWRSSSDSAGTKENNVTEHVYVAWSCYFTDGAYDNWQDKGDTGPNFGLLSWNQYNAGCYITFVR
jgi:hypothetical protein